MRLVIVLLLLCGAVQAAPLDVSLKQLTGPLQTLSDDQRRTLDRSISLVRRGEHLAALSVLRDLAGKMPGSSAIRVVLAYALVQAGNLAGAFDEARAAESASDHNSYVCLFLAKVALLAGDQATCKREVQHAKASGDHAKEVKEIERALATR